MSKRLLLCRRDRYNTHNAPPQQVRNCLGATRCILRPCAVRRKLLYVCLEDKVKQLTFHFCPGCGQYCTPGSFFTRGPHLPCPDCGEPIQLTGLAIWLVGFLASVPLSLVLCQEATELATAIFVGCTAIATLRWGRQHRAMTRHSANQASTIEARKFAGPQR